MKLRQKKGRLWLGRLKVTFSRLSAYVGYINFTMLVLTFYTVRGYKYAPLGVFIILAILGILVLATFDYFIMLPSEQTFRNEQMAKHQNPVYEEVKTVRNGIEKLEAEIRRNRKE